MIKYKILCTVVVLLTIISGDCRINGQTNDNSPIKQTIEEILQHIDEGSVSQTETFALHWESTTKVDLPEDAEGVCSHLVSPIPPLRPLYKALKNYEYKKKRYSRKIRITIKFYDFNKQEILNIGLARDAAVMLIDGEPCEPTAEIMQALKYLMSYETYEEISDSFQYSSYFVKKEDQPKKTEVGINDPNNK